MTTNSTPNTNVLEHARQGNPKAIASLINRSVQRKGITASVDIENGNLDVMLDAKQVPSENAANFIFNGIQKLDIEPAYDVYIYGRKAGQPFATWCHSYELKNRPFTLADSSKREKSSTDKVSGFTINLSGVNGETINLDTATLLGFSGVAITTLGIFTPVMSAPLVGTVDYFRNGTEEAILLIILTALSTFFLIKKYYSWLYGSSVWAFLLVSGTFLYYDSVISEVKSSVDRDLAGNPFRGLADLAMVGTGLEWGWFLLFLGTGATIATACLKTRKLDKQAWIALISPIFLAVGLFILSIPYYSEQANQSKESEAKTYIGSINRSQQAYFLENDTFAERLGQLELGIDEETQNYQYEIVETERDTTVATVTSKERGLKSFIGAVFLVKDEDGYMTTKAIVCGTNKPSRKPPNSPVVSRDGELQCASGSSN